MQGGAGRELWKFPGRYEHFVMSWIYRSLGVVSDKIASAKRNPVQTGNTTTLLTYLLTYLFTYVLTNYYYY